MGIENNGVEIENSVINVAPALPLKILSAEEPVAENGLSEQANALNPVE